MLSEKLTISFDEVLERYGITRESLEEEYPDGIVGSKEEKPSNLDT